MEKLRSIPKLRRDPPFIKCIHALRERSNQRRRGIVEKSLAAFLKTIGFKIARHPLYFILCTCILSVVLGTGLMKINYNRNVAYLTVSQTGRAGRSKIIVDTLYSENSTFPTDILRTTDNFPGVIIQVTSKNGQNVMHEDFFKELYQLDKIVQGIRINSSEGEIGFKEVCSTKDGKCLENPVIKLRLRTREFLAKKYRIKFPVDINLYTATYQPYSLNFGGVTVDEHNYIEEVQMFRLMYMTNKQKEPLTSEWENTVISQVLQTEFNNITVIPFVFSDFLSNVKQFTEDTPRVAAVVAGVVVLFSIVSCMTNDWVRSKPWLGLSACVSAGLSLLTAFGVMAYIGVDSNDGNICICFLILGTEIDDAFILIASWRVTSSGDSVEKRLGNTFKEAGVSITVTSLTNILSLCIGLKLPIPGVRQFCAYAATAMFITYVYQISFFGGCMALDGYREENKLNAITFRTSGEGALEKDKMMNLIKDKLGGLLIHTPAKIVIVIVFLVNLIIGIWGTFYLYDGGDPRTLIRTNSLAYKFLDNHYRYFGQYPGAMQIVLNQTLNYADPNVQRSIEEMLKNFTQHPNIAESQFSSDWLKYYKDFMSRPISSILLRGYDVREKEDFINGLRNVFLRIGSAKEFAKDIIFNENETEIVCSRFFVLLKDVYDIRTLYELLKDSWKIADQSVFPLTVHSTVFPLAEQGIIIRDITIQVTWLTAVLIMIVFFLFVPQPITALIVSVVIASTIIETAGYMSFWGVGLDIGTVTVIILCVGLSVNYPSHATYAFVTSKEEAPNDRLKDCLYHVGLPIIQGSTSTILSVAVLGLNQVRVYVIFFIIVFLIALFTTFHALFVVPVLLNLTEYSRESCKTLKCF